MRAHRKEGTQAVHDVQLTLPYLQARLVTSSVAGTDVKAPEGAPAGAQRSSAASGSVSVVALRGEVLQWRLLAVNRGQHWLWVHSRDLKTSLHLGGPAGFHSRGRQVKSLYAVHMAAVCPQC